MAKRCMSIMLWVTGRVWPYKKVRSSRARCPATALILPLSTRSVIFVIFAITMINDIFLSLSPKLAWVIYFEIAVLKD